LLDDVHVLVDDDVDAVEGGGALPAVRAGIDDDGMGGREPDQVHVPPRGGGNGVDDRLRLDLGAEAILDITLAEADPLTDVHRVRGVDRGADVKPDLLGGDGARLDRVRDEGEERHQEKERNG
jgi:hypothetical protein